MPSPNIRADTKQSSDASALQKDSLPVNLDVLMTSYSKFRSSDIDAEQYQRVRRIFQDKYGHITKEYYCKDIESAAVLTAEGYLPVIHGLTGKSELEGILLESSVNAAKAYRILGGKARYDINNDYYTVIVTILAFLDTKLSTANDSFDANESGRVTEYVQIEFAEANRNFEKSLQRFAKSEYFKGMVNGAKLWLGIATVLLFFLLIVHYYYPQQKISSNFILILTVFVSSGLGAIVSVMARMSWQNVKLDAESGAEMLYRLGMFRVIVGAILGLALYAMVRGGLLPLNIPEIPEGKSTALFTEKQLFFFAALSFLAGFGERWAQDMLSSIHGSLAPTTEQKQGAENK